MFSEYPVTNISIVAAKRAEALSEMISRAQSRNGGYCCFVNAHVSVMSRQRDDVSRAVNAASFAFPDGMPVYLVGRYLYGQQIEKISGPDFMEMMFQHEKGQGLSHFFYGGSESTLGALVESLSIRFPGLNIAGWISPPYREATQNELMTDIDIIRKSGAQLVWIGLGAPKQELWMAANAHKIPNALFLGVGAAFDFHAGTVTRAPYWLQRIGLEWMYRLIQEPRRLLRRYAETNTLFLCYSLADQIRRVMGRSA